MYRAHCVAHVLVIVIAIDIVLIKTEFKLEKKFQILYQLINVCSSAGLCSKKNIIMLICNKISVTI